MSAVGLSRAGGDGGTCETPQVCPLPTLHDNHEHCQKRNDWEEDNNKKVVNNKRQQKL